MEETALPDDIVLEVLVRVADVASLFRCALTCKRWRRLISDLSFLRRRWPENAHHRSSLVGFFTPGREVHHDDLLSRIYPCGVSPPVFVPAPRSALGPARRLLTTARLLRRATPLIARHGLLLVRLYVAPRARGDPVHLAVCNLLVGWCDVLPPLECQSPFLGYAVLTGGDCCSSSGQRCSPLPNYSTFFKVLAIGGNQRGGEMRYNLHAFSSAETSWSAPRECFREHFERGYWRDVDQTAAVCGGAAHWLFWDLIWSGSFILGVSAETGHVSFTKPPIPTSQFTIGSFGKPELCVAIDGTLSSFILYRDGSLRLEIWTRSSTSAADWLRTRVMKLKQPEQKLISGVLRMWPGEKSGTLAIVDMNLHRYIADLETGATEEATDQFHGIAMDVPVEIDWPALFVSRLGDRRLY